jgi:polyphenol oxidase
MIYTELFDACPELVYGFGDHSTPFGDVVSGKIELGLDASRIYWGRQVHGTGVYVLGDETPPRPVEGIDALITDRVGRYVAVKTADCVPVLLYDPVRKVVAAIHSGRECTRQNIVATVIRRMRQCYGTHPDDLLAAMGPAICPRCYEVDEATYARFVADTGVTGQFRHPDMKATITRQLTELGVTRIADTGGCTRESERYCSYRRNPQEGRQISFIGMRCL